MIGTRLDIMLTEKQKREACAILHENGTCPGHIGGTHSLGPLFGKKSKFTARNEK